ncbi:MAG: anhydro-N-acetylmuramic acid kinase [Candidatus Dadabacteria bacterium]|nr:anhydro-N-acetylmuramic acid kinase [Candidatus Dadabacteria bacterium]NIS07634.1 anhydro-N-acetylmuramic acid kinase [Candidatus Dadabacteria bacterium]NIV42088.1 anhydro-N-acetylmuramic acid kinase [Candidatus Dadabacteria bacterium]NIX16493.1 anhydro-N-acetylmuramic acid kinase [Candidatus Dadabacteria bacterium]NIY21272.1 anhydro-N-acetylmuramic acid kinase [Candidatus Dadabacteria bacterium]
MNPVQKLSNKKKKIVIGLMSGTSMDGIDSAIIEIKDSGIKTNIKTIGFLCKKYSPRLKSRLLKIDEKTALKEISELNVLVGREFAGAAIKCAKKFAADISNVDLIGSHGQTVYHNPPSRKLGVPTTVQLGDINTIAHKTGVTTVGDLRQRDIAAGGEGAPIMPYVDYILFINHSTSPVLAQNIGGIANVTVVTNKPEEMIAFDTGPGNMLMDGIVRLYSNGKKLFDRNGRAAGRGKVNLKLLQKLLADDYYKMKPPKSTGAEKYGAYMVKRLFGDIKGKKVTYEDMMRTLLQLTVETIAQAYENFIIPKYRPKKVILSGGGTKNLLMLSELRKRLGGLYIITSDELVIPSDAKEAIGMAVLANELVSGHNSNVPSCTGAKVNVPLGKISYGF